MSWLLLLLTLAHELFIFAGIVCSMGSALVLMSVNKSLRVSVISETYQRAAPIRKLIGPFYGIGSLLGLATAWVGKYDLLEPWLIATYVLVVFLAVLGATAIKGLEEKILAAAQKEPNDTPSEAFLQLLKGPAQRNFFLIDVVGISFIVFLMVFKPFS